MVMTQPELVGGLRFAVKRLETDTLLASARLETGAGWRLVVLEVTLKLETGCRWRHWISRDFYYRKMAIQRLLTYQSSFCEGHFYSSE